jgi:methionyl-tRNA synthetase
VSRFYITTPIYYINAEPHLGHAYTTMVADAVARAHRLMGEDVYFLTGTDEHGQKVERAAQKAGIPVGVFADQMAQKFREMLPLLNISNNDFIRTTEKRHYAASQALWRRVRDRGFIYKGAYEGWYCTVDEVFVPETQLDNGCCPTCGNRVERIAEESYFFRLSAFQAPLLAHYRQHPDFLRPDARRNEMLAFLEAGLEDLSISRTSFKWGIPVPDDPSHVIYVWFDALTNYMTAVGLGSEEPQAAEMFQKFWPADVHLMSKEIVRQHAIYWPAFLMAAELPPPRHIMSHGWWLMDGAKMSKSRGNVVRPDDYVERFGLDAVRYFVFREMVFGQDASFGDEALLGRYNADLANDLGNLVSRVTTMVHRYCDGVVPSPDPGAESPAEQELRSVLDTVIADVKNSLIAFQLSSALRAIWDVIGATNRYIVAREPWRLAKDAGRRTDLETTLYAAADALRVIAVLIEPFMPNTSARTLRMLGVPGDPTAWKTLRAGASSAGTKFGKTEALFPRIELSVEELRDMSDTNQPVTNQPVTNPAVPSGSPPAASATPSGTAPGESRGLLSIDEFMKVELRVAKVLEAERVPKSTRLLKLFVDTGVDQRTIVAGIAEAYEPAALVGRSVAIVLNLKPAKLMGIESNGMVLAASPEGGKPLLIGFDEPPPPGTRIR